MEYISAKEAAEKWSISQRQVMMLCIENHIEGAIMQGEMWLIPKIVKNPIRTYLKSQKCTKVYHML